MRNNTTTGARPLVKDQWNSDSSATQKNRAKSLATKHRNALAKEKAELAAKKAYNRRMHPERLLSPQNVEVSRGSYKGPKKAFDKQTPAFRVRFAGFKGSRKERIQRRN